MGFPEAAGPKGVPGSAHETAGIAPKIGELGDPGDLFEGYSVRASYLARGSSVKTQSDGIKGSFGWEFRHKELLVAAAAPSRDLMILLGESSA